MSAKKQRPHKANQGLARGELAGWMKSGIQRHGDLLVGRKHPKGEAAEAGRAEATEQSLKDSKLGLSPEVGPTLLEDSKLDPTPEIGPTPLKKTPL